MQSLGSVDDPRAAARVARAIEDQDEQVAAAAIWSANGGGAEIDAALLRALADARTSSTVKFAAAQQLRQRQVDVDPATASKLDELLGPAYGGGGYGGYGYPGGYYH